MSLFRLLSLPAKPLNKVMGNLKLDERFELSFTSIKARNIVKEWSHQTHRQAKPSEQLNVKTWEDSYRLFNWDNFCWEFYTTRAIFEEEDLPTSYRKIDEDSTIAVKKCVTVRGQFILVKFYQIADPREKALVEISKYLYDVLNVKVKNLNLEMIYVDDLDTLTNAECLREINEITVGGGSVTLTEISNFLDFSQSAKIYLDVNFYSGNLDYHKKLIGSWVICRNSKWFNSKIFLNMDLEGFSLKDPQFISSKTINKFLRQWISGQHERLVHFEITYSKDTKNFEKAKQLNTNKMVAGMRDFCFGIREEESGIMKNDETWASIKITNHADWISVEFYVHSVL